MRFLYMIEGFKLTSGTWNETPYVRHLLYVSSYESSWSLIFVRSLKSLGPLHYHTEISTSVSTGHREDTPRDILFAGHER